MAAKILTFISYMTRGIILPIRNWNDTVISSPRSFMPTTTPIRYPSVTSNCCAGVEPTLLSTSSKSVFVLICGIAMFMAVLISMAVTISAI